MTNVRHRILYVDAYDSFANNIVSLLRLTLDVHVEVVTHDEYKDLESLKSCLAYFDAVVVGPGPGDPRRAGDVGLIRDLWTLSQQHILPILGICLGFQDLCRAFGGEVKTLRMPRHGIVSKVSPVKQDIFTNFEPFDATNYHSLCVDLKHPDDASFSTLSRPSVECPELQPLAWDTEDATNGRVLLAARHTSNPFWGVQYHPESICTSEQGARIVSAWWTAALAWLSVNPRPVDRAAFPSLGRQVRQHSSQGASKELATVHFRKLQQLGLLALGPRVRWRRLYQHVSDVNVLCKHLGYDASGQDEAILLRSGKQRDGSMFGQGLGRFSMIGVVSADSVHSQYDVKTKAFQLYTRNGAHNLPAKEMMPDMFSYINQFMALAQVTSGPVLIPFWGGLMGYISYEAGLETINVAPTSTMHSTAPFGTERPDINFVFVTRSIVVDHAMDTVYVQSIAHDDAEWLDVTKERLQQSFDSTNASVVISNDPVISHRPSNGVGNGSLTPKVNGHSACSNKTSGHVANGTALRPVGAASSSTLAKPQTDIAASVLGRTVPGQKAYSKKIENCSTSIRAGDTYEICLTDQTIIRLQRRNATAFASGWNLFQQLCSTNPAPFSSFLRLHSPSDAITIVSSSPERFLSWSRDGHCQFRPIKGTVKKAPGLTYKHARAILESSKERAENLMITDLIRHDLHGIARLGSVHVPKLMQIEEYATVYQLVSVIEGDVSSRMNHSEPHTNGHSTAPNNAHNAAAPATTSKPSSPPPPTRGIDLLAASLPPGSMTGAPKCRSCQLIAAYEDSSTPRGVYAGVLGYLDVGGGGDFAVVIRTAVRWDGDSSSSSSSSSSSDCPADASASENAGASCVHEDSGAVVVDAWRVGAGGAVTAQSSAADEFAEMLAKLDSTLGAFGLAG